MCFHHITNKGVVLFFLALVAAVCPIPAQPVTSADSNAANGNWQDAIQYSSGSLLFSPNVAKMPTYGPRSRAARDTARRMDYHMSLFTGFYSGWGQSHGYAGAAPSFRYRLDDKWSLKASFAVATDRVGNTYAIRESEGRNRAPRRHNITTGVVGMDVAAEYRPNDRTMVAAHLYYMGGSCTPVWSMNNQPTNLDVWGGSMEIHYRAKNDNLLSLYLGVTNDRTGALSPLLYSYPGIGYRPGFMMCEDPWPLY